MGEKEIAWIIFGIILVVGLGCIVWITWKTLREQKTQRAQKSIKVKCERASLFARKTSLVEIKNEQVIAHLEQAVPALFKAGSNLKKAAQADTLCRVKFPAGKSWKNLAKSKKTHGAYRGFIQGNNGRTSAQVDLIPQGSTFTKATQMAGSAYNIAALIVGQHYMSQIDGKLDGMQRNLNQITSFQDNKYKSEVMSAIAEIKVIATFKDEILSNPVAQQTNLNNLYRIETVVINLLGQANQTIEEYTNVTHTKYEPYDKALTEVNSWFLYQGGLLEALHRIAELKHVLYLGAISLEQCSALLPMYTQQTENARQKLVAWHKNSAERLGIDADAELRKREGLDSVFHWLLTPFKGENKLRAIDGATAEMIRSQTAVLTTPQNDVRESLFEQDVEVVAMDGRLYYLPNASNITEE